MRKNGKRDCGINTGTDGGSERRKEKGCGQGIKSRKESGMRVFFVKKRLTKGRKIVYNRR